MFHHRSFPPPSPKRSVGRPRRFWLPVIVTGFGLLLIAAALGGADLRLLGTGTTVLSTFVMLYALWVAGRQSNRD